MNMRSGFVLPLTLLVIALLVSIVTRMSYVGWSTVAFDRAIIDREQARLLALSGLQCALNTLTIVPEKNEEGRVVQDNSPDVLHKKLIERLFPLMSTWRSIELQEKIDSLEGRIQFCLTCENGKINLNKLFDFSQKKWANEALVKKLCERIEALVGTRELFKQITDFLVQRGYPLDDITELLSCTQEGKPLIPAMQVFKNTVFYVPPKKNNDTSGQKRPVYLTDIFTVFTNDARVEPWFFSDGLCAILGLRRVHNDEREQREQDVEQWIVHFRPTVAWATAWDSSLAKVYEKQFSTFSWAESLLTTQFDPRVFSVVSYGTVGSVTQRLFAILEQQSTTPTSFVVKKLYWL